jgi:transposase-like protein
MMSKTTNKFSPEVRARAVRKVLDHQGKHPSHWAAIVPISAKIGCAAHKLNEWLRKTEVDSGKRAGVPTDVSEKMKALERENRKLRQANEILRKARANFAPGGAQPPVQAMIDFIDDHLGSHGVEPICQVLPIAPSTYRAHAAQRRDPAKQSMRPQRDCALKPEITLAFAENFTVYGGAPSLAGVIQPMKDRRR